MEIEDRRPSAVEFLSSFSKRDLDSVAKDVWSIGLRAMATAQAQMDATRLSDVGTEVVDRLQEALQAHVQTQQRELKTLLGAYFDKEEGKLPQRLDGLLSEDGDLSRALQLHLAPEGSTLARALARQVGESSPLANLLNPTNSTGFLATLERQIETVLDQQRSRLADQLDPRIEGSALQRLVVDLRSELAKADQNRGEQLDVALKALDANDEGSMISRLVREAGNASQNLLTAVNPDTPGSPMSVIRTSITQLIEAQSQDLQSRLETAETHRRQFEADVRTTLQRLESRKENNQRTTHGGRDFEDSVVQVIQAIVPTGPYIVEATGNTVGTVSRSKVGDAVVVFGPETAFAGARIVIEAKRDHTYSVAKAVAELEVARRNRDACVGVLVLAQSHASAGFPVFARHGSDVLVIWDEGDPDSDLRLRCAIELALALVVRQQDDVADSDLSVLADMEHAIEQEILRVTTMRRAAKRVLDGGTTLRNEIHSLESSLEALLAQSRRALAVVRAPERHHAQERALPISFPQQHPRTDKDTQDAPWPRHQNGIEAADPVNGHGRGSTLSPGN
ncbi:MAG: hypothetical protein R3E12_13825 [Candidatus Eisenbacteria bacterium]